MKTIFAGLLFCLSLPATAQKNCDPALNTVNRIRPADFISLIDTLQGLNFSDESKRSSIPKFVKKGLGCWSKQKFRVVNPGKPYNSTDVILGNRPRRELIYFGTHKNYLLLSYTHGGLGKHWHTLIFNYSGKTILRLWNIPGAARTKQEIISMLQYIKEKGLPGGSYTEF